jgi:hypothetical protein
MVGTHENVTVDGHGDRKGHHYDTRPARSIVVAIPCGRHAHSPRSLQQCDAHPAPRKVLQKVASHAIL